MSRTEFIFPKNCRIRSKNIRWYC